MYNNQFQPPNNTGNNNKKNQPPMNINIQKKFQPPPMNTMNMNKQFKIPMNKFQPMNMNMNTGRQFKHPVKKLFQPPLMKKQYKLPLSKQFQPPPMKKQFPVMKKQYQPPTMKKQYQPPKKKQLVTPPIILIKPILVGNFTKHVFRKKKGEVKSNSIYEWYAYIRGLEPKDNLNFISKVEFHLHETFKPNIVTINQPPYQIKKEGWGSFEIKFVIYFKDEKIQPITIFHTLEFPEGNKKKACFERYDELIFVNPTPQFKNLLENTTYDINGRIKCIYEINKFGNEISEDDELSKLRYFRSLVEKEIKEKGGIYLKDKDIIMKE